MLEKAWEGVGVVASARKLIGATNPLQAEPGTIRGDLAVQTGRLDLSSFYVFNLFKVKIGEFRFLVLNPFFLLNYIIFIYGKYSSPLLRLEPFP